MGGKVEVSTEDQLVNELLRNHTARLVAGDGPLEFISIKKVTKQVVAGMRFDLTAMFKKGGKTTECVVCIWYRAWLEDINEKVKIKAECGDEKITTKDDDAEF